MKILLSFFRYLNFLASSGNEHSIHSPFIFDIYTKAIRSKKQYYSFPIIENIRDKMLSCEDVIQVKDYGTGHQLEQSRKIKDIARISLKKPRLGQILFQLVAYCEPRYIIDLGTSLGITTMYLANAKPTSSVKSFEGCVNISRFALANFKKAGVKNIEIITGNIDDTLMEGIHSIPKIDFVFFDANHTYDATLRYFEICLQKADTESVFIFDDIHWSAGMEAAWERIKANEKVTLSIDLFHMGIIFFRRNQPKQHFILRI